MKSPLTTLEELYNALEGHDWSHMMSDDQSVYDRGADEARRINLAARNIDGGKKLVEDFTKHWWSDAPKPVLLKPAVKKTFMTMMVSVENMEAAATWSGGSVKGMSLDPEDRVVQLHGGGDWMETEAKVGDFIVQLSASPARYMAFTKEDYIAIFCTDIYATETP